MIAKLKKYGLDKKYFIEQVVGRFKKAKKEGFSTLKFKGIDFDETKDLVCASNGNLQGIKSCDIFVLDEFHDLFDFVEIKEIKDIISCDPIKKLREFEIESKFKDSIRVLKFIVNEKQFPEKKMTNKIDSHHKKLILGIFVEDVKGKKGENLFYQKLLAFQRELPQKIPEASVLVRPIPKINDHYKGIGYL